MKVLLVLAGVVAAASALLFCQLTHEERKIFKACHSKHCPDEIDENFRMKIFMRNKDYVTTHNQRYAKGKVTFKLALNEYACLLHHEFTVRNGYNTTLALRSRSRCRRSISSANDMLPDTVDWRKKGAVTPIKDQGSCGSCWAFSATGALEGQMFQKDGKLVSLSEQNLVDCSGSNGNSGCDGGLTQNAFKYIQYVGGIDTEKTYPYKDKVGACRYNPQFSGATVKKIYYIQSDEQSLKEAVAKIGPVSVAIYASLQSMKLYKSGVYYESSCYSGYFDLDHAVLVVGYGTENGQDYWLVKNSWGTSWGDNGYMKMARNRNNNCGIATDACYTSV